MTDQKDLKVVKDAPSIIVLLDAATQAQVVLASHLDPSHGPSDADADAALRKLLAILDDQKVVKAVDRLLADTEGANDPGRGG